MKYHKILAQCPTEMSAQDHKRTFAVNCDVRFTPDSGHVRCKEEYPLCANSGLMHGNRVKGRQRHLQIQFGNCYFVGMN
jgi:hypothetical protein